MGDFEDDQMEHAPQPDTFTKSPLAPSSATEASAALVSYATQTTTQTALTLQALVARSLRACRCSRTPSHSSRAARAGLHSRATSSSRGEATRPEGHGRLRRLCVGGSVVAPP